MRDILELRPKFENADYWFNADNDEHIDDYNEAVMLAKHGDSISGVHSKLLLNDSYGIYIPQNFCQNFKLKEFGLSQNDPDVQVCLAGPDGKFYWDAWSDILSKAKYTDEYGCEWYLEQDGDLFLFHNAQYEENMRNMKRNPDKLSNKELVDILEALTLNVVCSSNLFLGIENAKLKKKFNALYEEYTNTIKFYPNEDRQWTIDPELNEKLSLLHKNLLMILNKTYDNLTSYYSEEGLDDSDSAGAATARFLSCNIDPLRMTMAYPPKTKRNPSHEEHRDTMRKLYEMARASARGPFDIRLLDIAHGAVRMDELDHVLEQCDDKKVCDYAAYKKAFFIDKKMTKSNPYPGTYPKIDCVFDGEYLHSTNHYKTCREAKEGALEHFGRIIKSNHAGYSVNAIAKYKKILSQPEKLKCYFDRN